MMADACFVPRIEEGAAIRHHCVVIAQTWMHLRSALLPRNRDRLKKLQASGTHRRHVRFFLTLPHQNPVDITLISAAVSHVDQTVGCLRAWDGGQLARTTWPERRNPIIAHLLGAQDVMTWARQNIHAAGKARIEQRKRQSLAAALEEAANGYMDQVMRHVIDVRDD